LNIGNLFFDVLILDVLMGLARPLTVKYTKVHTGAKRSMERSVITVAKVFLGRREYLAQR